MVTRLVRWGFERFYREFAWTYDKVAAAVSWGQWQSWIMAVLPDLHGDLLEIGCGTGYLQRALAEYPASSQVFGLDRSRQMLALTRRRAPLAQLAQADTRALPYRSATFDCVASTFPSDYIAQPETLREIRRVLRPGGRLVVLLGAQFSGPPIYQRVIALLYRLAQLSPPDAAASPRSSATPLIEAMRAAGLRPSDGWRDTDAGMVYLITAEVS
jgi:ubiquinone/menaquinone biosynthesis C-methylase UbiE